jgi:hypothetical protein
MFGVVLDTKRINPVPLEHLAHVGARVFAAFVHAQYAKTHARIAAHGKAYHALDAVNEIQRAKNRIVQNVYNATHVAPYW